LNVIAPSPVLPVDDFFNVKETFRVEDKSPEVLLFEEELPFSIDAGVARAGVRFGLVVVILCRDLEDHPLYLWLEFLSTRHHV
jgi:hypothetical protein